MPVCFVEIVSIGSGFAFSSFAFHGANDEKVVSLDRQPGVAAAPQPYPRLISLTAPR
jgi:hypothetical protein